MKEIAIPGRDVLKIENIVFDFNGTLAFDGVISENVREYLKKLAKNYKVFVATADTYGTAKNQCEDLPITLYTFVGVASMEKEKLVCELSSQNTVAFGNGFNDIPMLKKAALSVAVLGGEGACSGVFAVSDITVRNIEEGMEILLKTDRIVADLRN